MKELVFLFPAYFLFILVLVLGLWKRGAAGHWLCHPSPFLLEEIERRVSEKPSSRWFRRWKKFALPATAFVSLVLALFVLAVPKERSRETGTETVGRIGVCVLDVSGSTLGGKPSVHDISVNALSRFIREWLVQSPKDLLGCVVFANGATPLGKPTNNAEDLVQNLRNARRLATDFGGGTQIERGIFAGFMMLMPELSLEDADKFESVLRRAPNDMETIRRALGAELTKCKTHGGKFAIILTDAIIELRPVSGMAPPLVMIELMGECKITPFVIMAGTQGYEEARLALAHTVARFGGRDYYVNNLSSQEEVNRVIADIAGRVPPSRREAVVFVSEKEKSDMFLFGSLLFFALWLIGTILAMRKRVPW